jgi:hypothetical protein
MAKKLFLTFSKRKMAFVALLASLCPSGTQATSQNECKGIDEARLSVEGSLVMYRTERKNVFIGFSKERLTYLLKKVKTSPQADPHPHCETIADKVGSIGEYQACYTRDTITLILPEFPDAPKRLLICGADLQAILTSKL